MNILLIIKGFIVGIAKIIPGVSGAMLAMTLGIYEKIIDAITNFFNNPKDNLKILLNFGIGCFIAIILFSKLILFLLNNYYYLTIYLFLGLILGTLINFKKKLIFSKKNIFILIISSIILFIFTNFKSSNIFIFKGTLLNYLYTILLGFIDAATSIIPGISGTVIYMLLGTYQYVLSILSNPFSLVFIMFLIGLFIGIIVVCYIMNYLLKYKKEETYIIIFAFMIISIITLFFKVLNGFNIYALILFIGGLIGGIKLKDN